MLSEKQTARHAGSRPKWRPRRPPIGLLLVAGLILVPLGEIAVFIEVGGWLGLGPTLALIVLTAVAGMWILRRQGLAVLTRAQQQMRLGVPPVAEVFEGLCLAIAGILLLTPGFLTDAAGALLLLPPVRAVVYRRLQRRFELREMPASGPYAGRDDPRQDGPKRGTGGSPVIDAEFEEVEPGPPGPMPEPRGGWDRRS